MRSKTVKKDCRLLTLGCIPYAETWQLQQDIAAARREGSCQDTLILVEHLSVFTLGRSGTRTNVKVADEVLAKAGLEVIEVDRGGDITYHGPGQLVGYPIIDLRGYKQDLHYYAYLLEEVIIRTLADYSITGYREAGLTGVWTGRGKIAAIGIGARGWVTMHGFAVNIDPDMSYFSLINPCGITDRPVVSMRELGVAAGVQEVAVRLIQQFAAVFGVTFSSLDGKLLCAAVSGRCGGRE